MPLATRPVEPADAKFLFSLFCASGGAAREALPEALRRTQFTAQRQSFPSADDWFTESILLDADRPVGVLRVSRAVEEIRLHDLALLPAARGRGLGTAIVAALQEEAAARGVPLRLHVAHENPRARELYERLGFTAEYEDGAHTRMVWRAES